MTDRGYRNPGCGDPDFDWTEPGYRNPGCGGPRAATATRVAVRICCPACPAGKVVAKAWRERQRRTWLSGVSRRCPDCMGTGYLVLEPPWPFTQLLANGGRVEVRALLTAPLVRYVQPCPRPGTRLVGYSSRHSPLSPAE